MGWRLATLAGEARYQTVTSWTPADSHAFSAMVAEVARTGTGRGRATRVTTASGADVLLMLMAFYLMLSPCGAAYSLDARRASW